LKARLEALASVASLCLPASTSTGIAYDRLQAQARALWSGAL